MLSNATKPDLKTIATIATMAAACTNCTAVALAERPAGFVSFHRHQPPVSPTQSVNSIFQYIKTARQFGGNIEINANNLVTTVTERICLVQHLSHLDEQSLEN